MIFFIMCLPHLFILFLFLKFKVRLIMETKKFGYEILGRLRKSLHWLENGLELIGDRQREENYLKNSKTTFPIRDACNMPLTMDRDHPLWESSLHISKASDNYYVHKLGLNKFLLPLPSNLKGPDFARANSLPIVMAWVFHWPVTCDEQSDPADFVQCRWVAN